MNLQEIKDAVDSGEEVCWASPGYRVIHDRATGVDQWLIKFLPNGHCIGLTHRDGVTLNGREDQFYKWKKTSKVLHQFEVHERT